MNSLYQSLMPNQNQNQNLQQLIASFKNSANPQ